MQNVMHPKTLVSFFATLDPRPAWTYPEGARDAEASGCQDRGRICGSVEISLLSILEGSKDSYYTGLALRTHIIGVWL